MDTPESQVHSFVVKLWLEQSGDEPAKVSWHGHITHVPGGERRYLKKLGDVGDFIEFYLDQMGVSRGAQFRVRRYLKFLNLKRINRH